MRGALVGKGWSKGQLGNVLDGKTSLRLLPAQFAKLQILT